MEVTIFCLLEVDKHKDGLKCLIYQEAVRDESVVLSVGFS